jgi:hypothetical protein
LGFLSCYLSFYKKKPIKEIKFNRILINKKDKETHSMVDVITHKLTPEERSRDRTQFFWRPPCKADTIWAPTIRLRTLKTKLHLKACATCRLTPRSVQDFDTMPTLYLASNTEIKQGQNLLSPDEIAKCIAIQKK